MDDVFEHAPAAVVVCAHDARVLAVNRAAVGVFGQLASVLVGRCLVDLFLVEDRPAVSRAIGELLEGVTGSYRGIHRVGERAGSEAWVELSVVAYRAVAGDRPRLFVHCHDVTVYCRRERELRHLADHDALTGLLNARRFGEELRRHVARAERYGPASALLVLDVDRFKAINDVHGHLVGDQVLRGVAEVLRGVLRESDLAARVGGDEFVVLLERATDRDAQVVAFRLVASVRQLPFPERGRVTISIGTAVMMAGSALEIEDVLRAADEAMYRTKRTGGDGNTMTRLGARRNDQTDDAPGGERA